MIAGQPIKQHDWFLRSGRSLRTAIGAVADLDLPDRFPLPENRRVILVANHRSLLDLPVAMAFLTHFGLSSRIQIQAGFMRSGPTAWFLRSIGAIPTSSKLRHSSERDSVEAVERGELLSIMPEGRLVGSDGWVDGVGPGRPGVSRVALAVDAVIVPVACSGTQLAWPPGSAPRVARPRPRIVVRTGDAFELASTDHRENARQVMAALAATLVKTGDPYANPG